MDGQVKRQEISDYYNTFCEEEKNLRLNIRHYTVFKHLVNSGLKKDHDVLEIGCGFGTVTSLMSKYLKRGSITATDISAERIASCQRQFKGKANTTFVLTDMSDFKTDKRFDFIVLPDVLEHIPFEAHLALFQLMTLLLKDDGTIFIHIPHPTAIEFLRVHNPSGLQIIDQPIHADTLMQVAYSSGLILKYFNAYSLASSQPDYELVLFNKRTPYKSIDSIPKLTTQWRKTLARIFFLRRGLF
jgi:trans-aconitate 2-methyltransferase